MGCSPSATTQHQQMETNSLLLPKVSVPLAGSGSIPAHCPVASQMATYLGKALNSTPVVSELVAQPGFKWKNKGSMVFIGDGRVSGQAGVQRGPDS